MGQDFLDIQCGMYCSLICWRVEQLIVLLCIYNRNYNIVFFIAGFFYKRYMIDLNCTIMWHLYFREKKCITTNGNYFLCSSCVYNEIFMPANFVIIVLKLSLSLADFIERNFAEFSRLGKWVKVANWICRVGRLIKSWWALLLLLLLLLWQTSQW